MNNRGFTLIELSAIVLILAAIFLVSFPALSNSAKQDEEAEYENMVKNLCLAGESYVYANMSEFSELSTFDSTFTIVIDELISYGNVDKNMKNIKTGKTIEKDSLKYTVLSDYSLDCEYIEY